MSGKGQQSAPSSAVVYGRNSSAKQKSIRDQIAECVADVERNGWSLVGEPLSDPSSASRYATKVRANWARLLDMLADIDVVVLWEPSRGDRTLASWVSFLDSCREHGVRIHAKSHGRTYDPRNARDYRSLAEDGVDSAYESDKISERLLRGFASAAVDGRPHAPTTYGYRRVYDSATKAFVRQEPDPAQAAIVQRIIRDIGRGVSIHQVTERLNVEEVPTQRGGRWSHGTIRSIATNVAYRPHPTDPEHGTRIHRDAEHIGQWPPLVTSAEFEAAAEILGRNSEVHRSRRRASPPGAVKYLLSGNATIATAACGSQLIAVSDRAGRGASYACKNNSCASAPMPVVDEIVARLVVERLSKKDAAAIWLTGDTASDAAKDELARLTAELAQARESFARPGGISAEALAMKEAAMAGPIEDARRRAEPAGVPAGLGELITATDVRSVWDNLPLLTKRGVIATLFERLSLGPATERLNRWSPQEERFRVTFDRLDVVWRTS